MGTARGHTYGTVSEDFAKGSEFQLIDEPVLDLTPGSTFVQFNEEEILLVSYLEGEPE